MDYFLALRFFALLITSLYVYGKVLDIQNISKGKVVAACLFSAAMSIPLSFMPPPLLFEFLFLGSILIFVAIVARVKTSLMISAVIISVGITLGIDGLASLALIFASFPLEHLFYLIVGMPLLDSVYQGTVFAMVQSVLFVALIVLVNLLFRAKRLKKGILFWENREAVRIGILFSVLIMISMNTREIALSFSYDGAVAMVLQVFVSVVVSMCALGFYFWWRHHTTALYKQQLREQVLLEQQNEIGEMRKQVKDLSQSNDFLSKAVHRDNKLLPAMYRAVKGYLDSLESAGAKRGGEKHLNELEEIMQERKDMISEVQSKHKALASTGIGRIDNILNYMCYKAYERDIEFDFVLAGAIEDIGKSVGVSVSSQQLETLLADLIENAIIATSQESPHRLHKKVRVTLGVCGGHLEVDVSDSGIAFEAETLAKLGVERVTTHASAGGSGIGYVSIFEILKDSGASLSIVQYDCKESAYTKSVKACFDGRSKHSL